MTERAFYARSGSPGRDFITLLHPPYTLWHLSYVAIGAALAPDVDWIVLAGALLAFLFGLGIGSHALDEAHDRPLRTGLSDGVLWALGIGGIATGVAFGVAGAYVIGPGILVWAAIGVLLATGYALEWSPVIHSDWGFAVSWGAFPVLVGYWSQTETVSWAALLMAAVATVLSRAQRELSTPARQMRRTGISMETDGWEPAELLATWERPLRLLSIAMPLLALSLLAVHL